MIHRRMQRERIRRLILHHDGLADQAVLTEVVAVIGHEDDGRVIPQIQAIYRIQDLPKPPIDHGNFAAIKGVAVP